MFGHLETKIKSKAEFPGCLDYLFEPARYKVAYGGRGGLKSWTFARALLVQGGREKLKILCAREFQNSIRDSVHALLKTQIDKLGLSHAYEVFKTEIRGKNGTEFIFRGITNAPEEIKSLEGVNRCWVEEAQKVSDQSWEVLIPTIREPGSEIWISFNPRAESDPTYQRFVKHPPPGSVVRKTSWRDNPWLSAELLAEKDFLQRTDPEAYEYVWEGGFEVARQGAYYHRLLVEAERAGRITSVPYDTALPVHTSWDIGVHDETVIWFWQSFRGGEKHVIDFLYGTDEGVEFYIGELYHKPYIYGTDYVPHDFKARSFVAGGRSAFDIATAHGRRMEIVPAMSVLTRIQATRSLLPLCWFDKQRCDKGLEALRAYHREWDVGRQTYKSTPEHDWSSHAADGFGTFAVSHCDPASLAAPRDRWDRPARQQGGWMSA